MNKLWKLNMRPHGWRNSQFNAGSHPGRGGRGTRAHHRGRHGRGGMRVLTRGELRLLLLSLLSSEARHGYELIRAIEALSEGAYAPSPGIVYPTLGLLQETGHIAAADGEHLRKTFTITEEGQAEVAANGDLLAELNTRLAGLATQDAEQNAPIRRALANLEMVLANATVKAGNERTHAIVALVDEAAQKIERLG